jgi:hypothetical protein
MDKFYQEFSFELAEDFLQAITPWSATTNLEGYIFRGHSDDTFKLLPVALRAEKTEELHALAGATVHSEWIDDESISVMAEFRTIRDFYRLADAQGMQVPTSSSIRRQLASTMDYSMVEYTGGWITEELLEVAALAQHYGLPTRLLDWSYNPYIAAFFSSTGGLHNGNLSLWCLNKDYITLQDHVHKSNLRFIHPHYSGNPNIAAQSGLFTHWERNIKNFLSYSHLNNDTRIDRTPLDDLLKTHFSKSSTIGDANILTKLKLPASQAPRLRKFLSKIGYTAGRIFPGYAGVAQSLKDRSGYLP